MRYGSYLDGKFSKRKELVSFLKMVKLKEEKLAWALKQKGKKNKDLAFICGVKLRRFQQLKAEYKRTGEIPMIKTERRPRTELTEDQKELILKAAEESKLDGAVTLRLYIQRYYGKNIPRDKLHNFLLKQKISKPDKKKKKQRKYCRYERKHSFSLVHLDWHEAKCVPGKQVCVVEDDASRLVIAGNEFDNAITQNNINLMNKASKKAFNEYSAIILAANTDRGSQFYANKNTSKGEKGESEFETYLKEKKIKHIPSRRNHPQTNGKEERWFRTYEEKRAQFNTFQEFINWYNNRIHLGLSRTKGITPQETIYHKLRQESLIGLFFRRHDQK